MTSKARAFEMTLDLSAPVEQVWAALTKAEELMRWCPLQASVTPGEGGAMSWSWEGNWKWDTNIDIWDPNRRLRLVQASPPLTDVNGKPIADDNPQPVPIAIDFQLETHEGKTRLRLVHSGFGQGAKWDDEVESLSKGWPSELRSLQHYLRWHLGQDRHVAMVNHVADVPQAVAWERLIGPSAFDVLGERGTSLTTGGTYTSHGATGDRFSGDIDLCVAPWEFFGTVRELNHGVFRLATFRRSESTGMFAWLSTYGRDSSVTSGFRTRATELLQRLFPAPTATTATR